MLSIHSCDIKMIILIRFGLIVVTDEVLQKKKKYLGGSY